MNNSAVICLGEVGSGSINIHTKRRDLSRPISGYTSNKAFETFPSCIILLAFCTYNINCFENHAKKEEEEEEEEEEDWEVGRTSIAMICFVGCRYQLVGSSGSNAP